MNVLHLVSSPERRGAQTFAVQLAAALDGDRSCHVLAVQQAHAARSFPIEAIGRDRWSPQGFVTLTKRLRHADVLIAHGSSSLLHGAVAARVTDKPFIYRNIGDPAAWGSVRWADLRVGHPMRTAGAVVTLYPAAGEFLTKRYRVDPRRIRAIPNAVPFRALPTPEDRSAAADALALDPELVWIGYLGALSAEKQPDAAIRSIAEVPGLGLLVAGSGPELEASRVLADRVAPGRIKFLGSTDRPHLVLDAVEALVLPSRTEGVPAVAIEAGLAGIPVVATRVGGVAQVIIDGRTGFLVDDASPEALSAALRLALANAESLGSAARARCAELFTMERVAPQWADLISEVVNADGGRSRRGT